MENGSTSITSISITTGDWNAEPTGGEFNINSMLTGSTATVTIDATGSGFSSEQYNLIIDGIEAAKAKLNDDGVTLTFDEGNID